MSGAISGYRRPMSRMSLRSSGLLAESEMKRPLAWAAFFLAANQGIFRRFATLALCSSSDSNSFQKNESIQAQQRRRHPNNPLSKSVRLGSADQRSRNPPFHPRRRRVMQARTRPTRSRNPHAWKKHSPFSPSPLATGRAMGGPAVRARTALASDRGRRRDRACGLRAGEHRLSGDP